MNQFLGFLFSPSWNLTRWQSRASQRLPVFFYSKVTDIVCLWIGKCNIRVRLRDTTMLVFIAILFNLNLVKWCVPIRRAWLFFYVRVVMRILSFQNKLLWVLKTIFKEKRIFYVRKKYICKGFLIFYIKVLNFLLQNAINTLYNLYCDYWDLITNFWPGA